MKEIVIQIKSGVTINVEASAKIQDNILCAKKVVFNPITHNPIIVLIKMVNI